MKTLRHAWRWKVARPLRWWLARKLVPTVENFEASLELMRLRERA